MFHLSGFRLRSPCPAQMGHGSSVHFGPSRTDGGSGYDAAGLADDSFISTSSLNISGAA